MDDYGKENDEHDAGGNRVTHKTREKCGSSVPSNNGSKRK
jgi:hypothetical protein